MIAITLVYALLFMLTHSSILINSTTQLSIKLTSSIPIHNTTTEDTCHKFEIGTSTLYHLSSQIYYNAYSINTTLGQLSSADLSFSCGYGMTDFSVYYYQKQMGILCIENKSMTYLTLFNAEKTPYYPTFMMLGKTATKFFANGLYSYQFYPFYKKSKDAVISRYQDTWTVHAMASSGGSINLSPDKKTMVVWDNTGFVYLYNASSFVLKYTYVPINQPNTQTTQSINFNSLSTLIAIQTDNYNPVIVLELQTFTVKNTITINDVIKDVQFLDSNDRFLSIVCLSSNKIVDLTTNKLYSDDFTVSTRVRTGKWNNKLYTCLNNVINEYTFSLDAVSSSKQTNTSFQKILNYTQIQQQLSFGLGIGITNSMKIANKIASISAASPFIIYFLSFMNYFTLSGVYVLLNIAIPEQLYVYLSLIYNGINSNIFTLLGLNVSVPPISQEKVNMPRPLYFGVSSDVFSSNFQQFLIITFNFIVLGIWAIICKFTNKKSFLYSLFIQNKDEMIFGQIIGVTFPIVLALNFVFANQGLRFFGCKINVLFIIFFTFLTLITPILYLKYLIFKRKQFLSYSQQLSLKSQLKSRVNNLKLINNSVKKIRCFCDLFTVKIMDKWFLYLANIIYPIFVTFQDPIYFLICILVFTFLSLLITLKDLRRNKNNFVLKLYPLVFHCCFCVFYFSSDLTILVITELICLFCLLIGSLHMILTLIVVIFHYLFKAVKPCFAFGSVAQAPVENIETVENKKIKIHYFPNQKKEGINRSHVGTTASKPVLKIRKCKPLKVTEEGLGKFVTLTLNKKHQVSFQDKL